jgi:hypothetical protein
MLVWDFGPMSPTYVPVGDHFLLRDFGPYEIIFMNVFL